MNFFPLELHFEKILERELERKSTILDVTGTNSSFALAFLLTQSTSPILWDAPQLVVLPSDQAAEQFQNEIAFFNPEFSTTLLSAFDISPYSGLYPNARSQSARMSFAFAAQTSGSQHIFISSATALMQRTLPPSILRANILSFSLNQDLPKDFNKTLLKLGYQSAPVVEDIGTFAIRGGIVDIYSPAHARPVRLELFGDSIESMRFFEPDSGRSVQSSEPLKTCHLIPPREILYSDELRMNAANNYRVDASKRGVEPSEKDQILQSIIQAQIFPGMDFLIGDFYDEFATPLDHFKNAPNLWLLEPADLIHASDEMLVSLKAEFEESSKQAISPKPNSLYLPFDQLDLDSCRRKISFHHLLLQDAAQISEAKSKQISWSSQNLDYLLARAAGPDAAHETAKRVGAWRAEKNVVFVCASTQAQAKRLELVFEKLELSTQLVSEDQFDLNSLAESQKENLKLVHIIERASEESLRLTDEHIIFLRDEDFFGKKQRKREHKTTGSLETRAGSLSFSDLNIGDRLVHVLHGIGVYEGLKVMPISGIDSEFIQISYKDGDKLYLPIYRINQINRYGGPGGEALLDKLGGTGWQKTKAKVKNHLRDIANDLLELYALRAQMHRPPFPENNAEFLEFEAAFPYDETDDQLKAVRDLVSDMVSDKPMDRLICGDVGFGKTEVAIRAAFKAVQAQKQIAVLAPTTVLSFQHVETFQKRFKNWPVTIRGLNRFVSTADAKKTLAELKEGKVDIIIGTHRLLSKDIAFKDLGLMIIDEEHKFGVTHKERIKKMKASVDTLTLSATPIPRTLNMSLLGMRDLSIINTPPVDRLPTRTFVTKFDDETIRKGVESEIARSGQVFFLHNRVQSIYQLADHLKEICPGARIRVGHGQMAEHELESTMLAFFNHEIDILVCTTIVESGIDNPRANTMFIDNAHQLGLATLYQLRGRVGRSKERAYCYLLIPANKRLEKDAQERLKVIQENTALGSGIRIAHHDLELRGAGNILGESQSGHIDSVGYEMYMELLDEAIRTAKGEEVVENIEPEINVRIPALIPNDYIPDIRIRLSYYKELAQIESLADIDRIEDELRDQFGKLPEQVVNLMGLMLIRSQCRALGIRDISSGPKTISLSFTERTPLPATKVVELTSRDNKKYSITPDMRLIVRMNTIAWPNIHEELNYLLKLI
jgi:transcription-repair coupling factor (superfamily II helicase)